MKSWRRVRRPILSDEERDLLIRLYEGEELDFTSEQFWLLDRFRRLRLIESRNAYSNRRLAIKLTDRGTTVVKGILARRWVEEHGTRGDQQ